ncbi:hypothetical protein P171DRAFT_445004 [Karstenula rhodostoma CBS 690.94]|uniref:Uncharacterized protein n=1 Tax=Karstenula rhodostoma CBS 690.94 TaxID=1392251 RepID=A0A9P4PGM4_9PLEO|nr:hypothetical protein P171DRAFT_445004 [Karstenula rhodostoma CBS 690.94]
MKIKLKALIVPVCAFVALAIFNVIIVRDLANMGVVNTSRAVEKDTLITRAKQLDAMMAEVREISDRQDDFFEREFKSSSNPQLMERLLEATVASYDQFKLVLREAKDLESISMLISQNTTLLVEINKTPIYQFDFSQPEHELSSSQQLVWKLAKRLESSRIQAELYKRKLQDIDDLLAEAKHAKYDTRREPDLHKDKHEADTKYSKEQQLAEHFKLRALQIRLICGRASD